MCRYDDGDVVHNIETTNTGLGGVQSHPDDYYLTEEGVPEIAVRCGSDLRALIPRQMLGLFVGLRARYFNNLGDFDSAEPDLLFARWLFPENRQLWNLQMTNSVAYGFELFDAGEPAHPLLFTQQLHAKAARAMGQGEGIERLDSINVGW
jgi:hypothetical protein